MFGCGVVEFINYVVLFKVLEIFIDEVSELIFGYLCILEVLMEVLVDVNGECLYLFKK